MKKIATYRNGNVMTTIYDNGTKTHYTRGDAFRFLFPESYDISISQRCDNGCRWCYYGCSPDGKHGELLNWDFFDSMRPYTEAAVNLQLPLNPQFVEFLGEMKKRKVIVNVTVNQFHFMDDDLRLKLGRWTDAGLINGIGISMISPSEDFLSEVKKFDNAVIHVIAGVTSVEDIMYSADEDLKLLILGYKTTGRGKDYIADRTSEIDNRIESVRRSLDSILNGYKVVCLDNLAVEQLKIKERMSRSEWEMFYGGDDGTVSLFIDLVKGTFARNSTSPVSYPIENKTIDGMFYIILEEMYLPEKQKSRTENHT